MISMFGKIASLLEHGMSNVFFFIKAGILELICLRVHRGRLVQVQLSDCCGMLINTIRKGVLTSFNPIVCKILSMLRTCNQPQQVLYIGSCFIKGLVKGGNLTTHRSSPEFSSEILNRSATATSGRLVA